MNLLSHKFNEPVNSSNKNTLQQSSMIRQYQQNLKIFLKKVDEEVTALMNKYQSQIRELKSENHKLRTRLNKYQTYNPEEASIFRDGLKNVSPIRKQAKDEYEKVIPDKLKGYSTFPKSNLNFNQTMTFKSYLDYEHEDLSSSRFEAEKNRKKQHQQSLLTSIVAGKNNLDLNTTKLLDLLGKNKSQKQQIQSEPEQQQVKSTQDKQQYMNSSISSVCQSLDNSFHGKRSKKKNEQKRKQKQRIKQMRLQQARRNFQEKKQMGLKNLLSTIRQNVSLKQSKPLQTLKSVKINQSGYQPESGVSKANQSLNKNKNKDNVNKSKVLIDPNPVDISQRKSRSIVINQTPKKPQSILKNSSTILSKSVLSSTSFVQHDWQFMFSNIRTQILYFCFWLKQQSYNNIIFSVHC